MSLKQNIIYLYFKGKHLITSKSQYQYNHGQFLYFADLDLPQTFEVHFSNRDRGDSKPQVGSNKLVEIPDEYYWSGALMIYAWIYLHTGKDDGETIYEVKIPLIKRAKPTNEEPLPVQQSAIDKAIAELNNAVDITNENADKTNADKTQVATIKEEVIVLKEEIDSTANAVSQNAQSARESADASEQSAQNSAEFENNAHNYADEAKGYAQSALESKNTASQKAQVATDASAEAKGYRDDAETFKNEAEQAKQNIVDYRNETKGYRDETLTAKDDVQTIKGDVQSLKAQIDDTADNVFENAREAYQSMISADNASLSASESAENASQSANEANQSASNASESANQAEEFKNQSATNVTHYPKVVDGYWYVWDASENEYVNTNVDARGIKGDKGDVGISIENTVLNSDYTLTITFTDGTSYTTPSIRGEKGLKGDVGNGIASTVLNDDYTLTITFTDGTTYKTPSIRGEKGEKGEPATDMEIHICSASEYDAETRIPTIANPNDKTFYLVPTEDGTSPDLFTEWVYVNGAWEMFGSAKIDLSGYLTDVQINGTSIVADGVAVLPTKPENNKWGLVRIDGTYGIYALGTGNNIGKLYIDKATSSNIKDGTSNYKPIVTSNQHEATFYGLAKASGTDEKDSTLPVGQYTDEAKSSIQDMLDVPSNADLLKAFPVETASGSIVSFEDGADDIPLQSLVVDINPVQDLHGYDHPWVAGGGKNKLPYPYYSQDGTLSGVTFSTAQDGKITASGTTTEGVNFFLARDISLAAGTYTLSIDGTHTALTLLARNPDAGITLASIAPSQDTATFTLAETANVRLYFNTSVVGTSVSISAYVQLEVGNQATAYAPYKNICPISGWTQVGVEQSGKNLWDEEWEVGSISEIYGANTSANDKIRAKNYISVKQNTTYFFHEGSTASMRIFSYDANKNYIGYVDVRQNSQITTGENVCYLRFRMFVAYGTTYNNDISINYPSTDMEYHAYTGSQSITIDLGQTVYGGHLDVLTGILTVYPYYASYNGETLTGRWISDRDVYAVGTTPTIGAQVVNIGAQGTGIQLEPHEVASLLGQNNIFADTGDTTCEYRADTELFIERLTDPDSADIASLEADVSQIKEELNGVNNLESSTLSPAWSQGTIASSGTDAISDIRIRTDYIRFQKGAKLSLNIADGYKASVSMYNANKVYLRGKYWLTGDNTLESYADGYVRIVLGKTNDSYVLPSRDDPNVKIAITHPIVENISTLIDGGYADAHIDYNQGGYISSSNGSLLYYSGWKYTDFIKIDDSANGKLLIKLLGPNGNEITTGANFNGWYDASKKYIGNLAITNQELTIPNNAVYIRLSANNSKTIILQLYLKRVTASLTDSNNLPYKLFESERVKAKYVPYSVGNNSAESYGGTQYNRANFLFFTDCHIDYFNRLADTQNVKDVVSFANKFPLKFDAIINAGDIITPFGRNTKQSSKEKFAVFTDEVKKLTAPVIFAKGNHDLNDWNNTPANTLTDADWSEMWYDYAESQYGIVRQTKASGEKSTWHYYDIADKKIRIIAVDVQDTDKEKTNADGNVYYYGGVAWYISNEQINWIVDVALNFDDKTDKNWGVIVVSHQWNYGDYTDDDPKYQDATLQLQHILNAFNTQGTYSIDYTFASDNFFDMNVDADFTRYASEAKPPHVICWLLGHEHLDQYKQTEGINIIWTTCSAVDTSGDSRVARVVDTVTQNAFDLISIDTEHRKIRYVRYGAGTNCYGVSGDRFLPDGLSY